MSDDGGGGDSKHLYNVTCIVPSIFSTWSCIIPMTTPFSSCLEYKHVINEDIRHREIK